MKQNHLNGKNGSVLGSFLRKHKKELPLLSSLKFSSIPKMNSYGSTDWHDKYFKKTGIYVVKDEKRQKFMQVGRAEFCLYRSVYRYVTNFKDLRKHSVAFVLTSSEKASKLQKRIQEEILKIPLDHTFLKIKPYLFNTKKIPLSIFKFQPPFCFRKKNGWQKNFYFQG